MTLQLSSAEQMCFPIYPPPPQHWTCHRWSWHPASLYNQRAAQRLLHRVQCMGPRALNLGSRIFEYAQHDPGTGFFPAFRIWPKIHAKTMKHGLSTLPLTSILGGEKRKVLYITASLEGHGTCTKGPRETLCAGDRKRAGLWFTSTSRHWQREEGWKGESRNTRIKPLPPFGQRVAARRVKNKN